MEYGLSDIYKWLAPEDRTPLLTSFLARYPQLAIRSHRHGNKSRVGHCHLRVQPNFVNERNSICSSPSLKYSGLRVREQVAMTRSSRNCGNASYSVLRWPGGERSSEFEYYIVNCILAASENYGRVK